MMRKRVPTGDRRRSLLRRARAFTQAQLAEELGVPQSQISRIEHQAELYVSTLARYLEAMGGHLEPIGVFDDLRVRLALGTLTHPDDSFDSFDSHEADDTPDAAPD
jgi:transcriptional regulator with XRE-family HTH domain